MRRAGGARIVAEVRIVRGRGGNYKLYSLDLAGKTEVFAFRTGADKVIHTTLVMPGPISRNQYADAVQSVATAEDLFVP